MRNLNAETKQLQDALQEWEDKFDERVQELEDEHKTVEASLRAHVRSLEDAAEESRYRIYELEQQTETASQSLEVAESANLQLEKRLEIMSDLLATSAKIDLHAETPGRSSRKHTRPKSMLPRFPTTGNLMASPERRSICSIPASPSLSFAGSHHDLHEAISHQEPLEAPTSHSEYTSDAESATSDVYPFSESLLTADLVAPSWINHTEMLPPAAPASRGRPTRRMRRFGAGSIGPRPLILPAASNLDSTPASAPALERHETPPHFPFTEDHGFDEGSSPVVGRRRASTMADQATLARLEGVDFLQAAHDDYADDSVLSLEAPGSVRRQVSQGFSSLGSCSGARVSRNLMEELSQMQTVSSEEPTELDGLEYGDHTEEEMLQDDTELAEEYAPALSPIDEYNDRTFDEIHAVASIAAPAAATLGLRSRSSSLMSRNNSSAPVNKSYLARLRALFGDLWRSPVDLARHLIRNAAARVRIPTPLRNVQWWLVSVLLGPMAKRRLLSSRDESCDHDDDDYNDERQRLLLPASPSRLPDAEVNDHLAYGTMYRSPASSPSRMARHGRKRTRECRKCSANQGFADHSPWMWLRFSITLAFAIGYAFKSGPATLLRPDVCACQQRRSEQRGGGGGERKELV